MEKLKVLTGKRTEYCASSRTTKNGYDAPYTDFFTMASIEIKHKSYFLINVNVQILPVTDTVSFLEISTRGIGIV